MQKMKALVKTKPKPGGVEYQNWDIPHLGSDRVLIKVMAAGICGSDIHLYHWGEKAVREYNPKLPFIMGHEFAGVIDEVGAQVEGLKVGDRVMVNPMLPCGKCFFCQDGRQNICDHRGSIGLTSDGAFAQFASIPSINIFKLEDEISFELGALAEPTCVGLHAIERIRVTSGDTVAIVGAGPVGLMMMILAKHSGAAYVFITGLEEDRKRLEIARKIGAIPIEVQSKDPQQEISEYTNGLGADVVFETAGTPKGIIQSLNIVRKGGRVCILSFASESTEIPTAILPFREIELVGTRAFTRKNWQRVSPVLLKAEDDLKRIITHRLPLRMAVEGFNLMDNREGLKVILLPWEQ